MARNEGRRQKRLMKKRQKDKLRRKAHTGVYVGGPGSVRTKIHRARDLPVHECLINPSWQEDGLAQILISRRQPDGSLLFGVYLVDVWCLGLKSTFCNADVPAYRYDAKVRPGVYRQESPVGCPLPLAHQIIYGGIDYAAQFGFTPDRDFRLSRYVLEERDSIEPWGDIEFGKDGKPFYVSGPHDNPQRVIAQLQYTVGEGNYDFLVGGPVPSGEGAGLDMPIVHL